MTKIDDQNNKWIVYPDGAFISKRNWAIRQWTGIGIAVSIFIGLMFIWNLTILDLIVQAHNVALDSQLLTEPQSGSLYFAYLAVFLGLAYFSWRIGNGISKRLFETKLNDFLVNIKEDWKFKGKDKRKSCESCGKLFYGCTEQCGDCDLRDYRGF